MIEEYTKGNAYYQKLGERLWVEQNLNKDERVAFYALKRLGIFHFGPHFRQFIDEIKARRAEQRKQNDTQN